MEYHIQRGTSNGWQSEQEAYASLSDAKQAAQDLDIGDKPEALRIVDDRGTVCGWVSRNGHKPSGALAPQQTKIQGTVYMSVIGEGSKSERETHNIDTDNGQYFVLRLKGGNAMFDESLNPLVGHKVELIGYVHQYFFIIDTFTILD